MIRPSWVCFAIAVSACGTAGADALGAEAGPGTEARLEVILRVAMERNPDLRESRAPVGAADTLRSLADLERASGQVFFPAAQGVTP